MVKKDTIHFVLTGGTIDSYYNGIKDTVVPNIESVIPNYISGLKLHEAVEFTTVCMKDSREITSQDREKVLICIEKSPHKNIIITHGTYTMPDTAKILKNKLKRKDQTIVFTGSMIPISGFTSSDGPFNLGYSLAKVQELSPGIYICMNGQVFSPEEVIKSLYEGKFVSVFWEK